MIKYYIDSVVCDFGIFEKIGDKDPSLVLILSSSANAELIVEILTEDLKKREHPAIKRKFNQKGVHKK